MTNPISIAMSMIFGLILILLWIPSVVYSEINNKGNRLETIKLKETLKTAFLHTGKIKNTGNLNLNTKYGNASFSNSVYANENYNTWIKKQRKNTDSEGNTTYTDYYDWSNSRKGESSVADKLKIVNDNKILEITSDKFKKNELDRVSKITNKNNITINLDKTYKWEKNNIVPNFPVSLYKQNITTKSYFTNIPEDTQVTIFALNENLDKVNDESTRFIYPGTKTKESIMEDRKSSNKIQKWVFRIGTFFILLIGLNLLVSPLQHILNETPKVIDFPIIKILKPFVSAFSGIVLFLWHTFSFLGSFILTAILTAIVYLLVNYTVIGGVSLGVLIIVIIVLNLTAKKED